MNTGWIVNLQFGIYLHKKDRHIELIQTFFGDVRIVASYGTGKVPYRVSSIKDLNFIIHHFDNFPLITHKWSDFQLFKAAFELVKYKKHLMLPNNPFLDHPYLYLYDKSDGLVNYISSFLYFFWLYN